MDIRKDKFGCDGVRWLKNSRKVISADHVELKRYKLVTQNIGLKLNKSTCGFSENDSSTAQDFSYFLQMLGNVLNSESSLPNKI